MSTSLLDLARRTAAGSVTAPAVGHGQNESARTARPPTRSELLLLAGDAAQAINAHCEACERCHPEAFVGNLLGLPLCSQGIMLRNRYRQARETAIGGRK